MSERGNQFLAVLLAYKGVILIVGSWLAYQVSDVSIPALNDSRYIGLSIYSTTLMAIICTPVAFLLSGDQVDGRFILLSGKLLVLRVSHALIIEFTAQPPPFSWFLLPYLSSLFQNSLRC